jgi:hypothetical protein
MICRRKPITRDAAQQPGKDEFTRGRGTTCRRSLCVARLRLDFQPFKLKVPKCPGVWKRLAWVPLSLA